MAKIIYTSITEELSRCLVHTNGADDMFRLSVHQKVHSGPKDTMERPYIWC